MIAAWPYFIRVDCDEFVFLACRGSDDWRPRDTDNVENLLLVVFAFTAQS